VYPSTRIEPPSKIEDEEPTRVYDVARMLGVTSLLHSSSLGTRLSVRHH
jgi:hypothetical protein